MSQIEREYKNALDEMCFSQDAKERMAENLATQQKRGRVPAKGRGLRPLRAGLAAACLCLALVGTAFAASPELRNMLAEALGGFAPYVQKQNDTIYTWNGFEFKVLSAIADENTVRVYVQAKDLEGRNRLDMHNEAWVREGPWFSLHVPESSVRTTGGSAWTSFRHYDAETQTAVVVTTVWGRMTENLTGVDLRIDTAQQMMDHPDQAAVIAPLDVRALPTRTLFRFDGKELGGMKVEEIRASSLSFTVIVKKEGILTRDIDATLCICLKDGTQVSTAETDSGYGIYEGPVGEEHEALIWNFPDPVEPNEITGIYIGDEYFPIK